MTSTPDLRTIAQQIFQRTLAAIDAETAVRGHLRVDGDKLKLGDEEHDLSRLARICVIGLGKASVAMGRAVESTLGERLTDGLIVTNALIGDAPSRMRVLLGGHPLPNAASFAAAEAARTLLRAADREDTLVIFLISGGGSALFEKPIDGALTLADLQAVNRALVGCGAVISEMNIVRRRLSAVKGGRLAEAARRARQISLYISDVNSDDVAAIASGPTLPETATRADFERVIERYDLLRQFPPRVSALISSGALPEMPPPDPHFAQLRSHHLLLDNRRALAAARRIAEQEYNLVVEVADDLIEGEVEEMASVHLARLAALQARHAGRTVCLLSGGEVICPVRGDGVGGRNQEFALWTAFPIYARPAGSMAVLSAGTDGIDGNSPAAGAIADPTTVRRGLALKMRPHLHCLRSDSFTFFNALGDAIITGPTGNNVRDLRVLLAR